MNLDQSPAVFFTYQDQFGSHGIFHECSQNLAQVFDLNAQAIIANSQTFFDYLGPINTAIFQQQIRHSFVYKKRISFEICTGIPPKVQHWFEFQFSPDLDQDKFLGHGVILNIDELHAKVSKLERQLSIIERVHDAMPDLFYYKDAHSGFLGGNLAWKKFHKIINMKQWIGKTDKDSEVFAPHLRQEVFEEEQALMRSGKTLREREIFIDDNGETRFNEFVKTPVYDEKNELVGLVGITRDVTDQVNTEINLENAKIAAEQAARAKSSFLAVMSHEIRTPMNGVIGCASLLEQTSMDDDQRNLLHTIKSCGESLLVIINDILDYSKIESGLIVLDQHRFHLREMIEDTFAVFTKPASDKTIELAYLIHQDVPDLVEGDSARLRQVITNLLGNAVKFTERGEVVLECSVKKIDQSSQECELLFSIRDTGIGIAPENQEKLFAAFTQADSSVTRKFGGTGLGLVISKKIVEHMGGTIWFTSEETKGTNFFFNTSLKFDPAESLKSSLPNIEQLKGVSALIVDDNATNRKIISSTIMQWGMKATAFESPKVALENLQFGHEYDIAIFDYCMPDMNGDTLSKLMKDLPQCSKTPIIILSSAADRILYKDKNFVWLQKPARTSEMAKCILKLVKGIDSHLQATQTTQRNKNQTRILVVDDNPINLMVATKIMQGLGYEQVETAANGLEAVEKAKNHDYDVIFMDLQMPQMDGFEAAQQIRAQVNHPTSPWIIALTADVQQQVLDKTLESGMNAYTTKPIQSAQIQVILEKAESTLPKNTI